MIAYNLEVHMSATAAAILREKGACFQFLPRSSPALVLQGMSQVERAAL